MMKLYYSTVLLKYKNQLVKCLLFCKNTNDDEHECYLKRTIDSAVLNLNLLLVFYYKNLITEKLKSVKLTLSFTSVYKSLHHFYIFRQKGEKNRLKEK